MTNWLKRLWPFKRREHPEAISDYRTQVALQAWNTGRAQIGTVDDDGNLTITEIESSEDNQ